ncbi:MAG: hypothetical protein ABJA98_06620 [Acidobacteriota bacterium]
MVVAERSVRRLAFFGRLADDLTRRPLRPGDMTVTVAGDHRSTLLKGDGHFAVVDLQPSATDYQIQIGGPAYQTRTVAKALTAAAPVPVTFAGEDELYVVLGGAPTPQNRISFEPLAFVPTVEAGASVIGQGGFTATLAEPLEGRNVNSAVLSTVAGLVAGQLLRIVRSPNLLLRPGPTYAFPSDVTVVVVHVVENDPAEPALAGATLAISKINGAGPIGATVGGLPLSRFALGGTAVVSVVLDDEDRAASSNDRGDAVFYFSGEKALTSLAIDVSKAQYQPAAVTMNVTANARNVQKVSLTRL